MELIKWLEIYSVRNPQIDEQHKILLKIVNQIFDSIKEQCKTKTLKPILEKLVDYTKYHFEIEELLLEKYDFLQTNEHKLEHKIFIDKIIKFRKDFEEDKNLLSFDLFSFLREWIYNHIAKSDKAYYNYFNINGITDFFTS
jgi:hemerythrin